jgi:hypothetical protein
MDKAKLKAAMKAVTAGLGRKPGGGGVSSATADKLRVRLEAALVVGTRTTKAGKVVAYNAANTVRMAARLLAVGGAVPEVVRTRFGFALAIPALREMAEVLGCDADALVLALVAPAEPVAFIVHSDEAEADVVTSIVQPVDAVAPRRTGSRRG